MRAQLIDFTSTPQGGAEFQAGISRARDILDHGGLVATPTETVYGLCADAKNDEAVAKIYTAKGRPSFNPLIAHVSDMEMAHSLVDLSPMAQKLAAAFWPGPLTIVAPGRDTAQISPLARAGLSTLAVRLPAHPIMRALISSLGRALVAPSANRSGSLSPTTAEAVMEGLGAHIDAIIDAGPCEVGVESTIIKVAADQVTLLRPGGVSREQIETLTGSALSAPEKAKIEAPGMLASHYAPRAPLRLNREHAAPGEAFLDFAGSIADTDQPAAYLDLSPSGNLAEAATNLFSYLRQLDILCQRDNLRGIAAAPIPGDAIGEAINDRLARAAAPRND